MVEQKHTPGQWVVSDRHEDVTNVLDADGFPIAICEAAPILEGWSEKYPKLNHWASAVPLSRTQRERSDSEREANARLIAAAPDLLYACKDALGTLMHEPQITDRALWPLPQTLNTLQAAIDKAEGR